MQSVFLSYSRKDADFMRQLRGDLEKHFLVWTDEQLEPGTPSWKSAIEENIEGAGCLVALLSPDAKVSKYVGEELSCAEIKGKSVVPVIIRGDANTAIPLGLLNVQWIDLRTPGNYETELNRLIAAIRKVLADESSAILAVSSLEGSAQLNTSDELRSNYFLFDKRHEDFLLGKGKYIWREKKKVLLIALFALCLFVLSLFGVITSSKTISLYTVGAFCFSSILLCAIVLLIPRFIRSIWLHNEYGRRGTILSGKVTKISHPRVKGSSDSYIYTIFYEFYTPSKHIKGGSTDYKQYIYKRTRSLPVENKTELRILFLDDDNYFPL